LLKETYAINLFCQALQTQRWRGFAEAMSSPLTPLPLGEGFSEGEFRGEGRDSGRPAALRSLYTRCEGHAVTPSEGSRGGRPLRVDMSRSRNILI